MTRKKQENREDISMEVQETRLYVTLGDIEKKNYSKLDWYCDGTEEKDECFTLDSDVSNRFLREKEILMELLRIL